MNQCKRGHPLSEALTYTLITAPPGAVIDAQSGLLQWQPVIIEAAAFSVRVSDGHAYAEQHWTVQVLAASTSVTAAIEISPEVPQIGEAVTLSVIPGNYFGELTITASLDGNPLVLDANYQAVVKTPLSINP